MCDGKNTLAVGFCPLSRVLFIFVKKKKKYLPLHTTATTHTQKRKLPEVPFTQAAWVCVRPDGVKGLKKSNGTQLRSALVVLRWKMKGISLHGASLRYPGFISNSKQGSCMNSCVWGENSPGVSLEDHLERQRRWRGVHSETGKRPTPLAPLSPSTTWCGCLIRVIKDRRLRHEVPNCCE